MGSGRPSFSHSIARGLLPLKLLGPSNHSITDVVCIYQHDPRANREIAERRPTPQEFFRVLISFLATAAFI